jgi:hypothetical protein
MCVLSRIEYKTTRAICILCIPIYHVKMEFSFAIKLIIYIELIENSAFTNNQALG